VATCPCRGGGGISSVLQGGYVFEKAAMIQHHAPRGAYPPGALDRGDGQREGWASTFLRERYHI
jgi:hypothetical protein